MSDGANIMPKGYGTPLVWLFYDGGDVLRMENDTPLASFIIDFNYTYEEENDDTCDIKLQFQRLDVFNLPYLKQDVRLEVQWGYLTGTGEFIKSNKIKVAIRDIEMDYLAKGIFMTLKCTDLVSYLKNQKTTTFRQYQNKDGAKFVVHGERQRGYFIEWLKELVAGTYTANITVQTSTLKIGKDGVMHIADYDPKTGRRTNFRTVERVPELFAQVFHAARSTKGAGKAIPMALADKLKFFPAEGGINGHYIQDTTGDSIHIHQRNFGQDIFASFTYYGGTGELLSFKSKTNTKKIKQDKAKNSGVNPYTKDIENSEITTTIVDPAYNEKAWIEKYRSDRDRSSTVSIGDQEILIKDIKDYIEDNLFEKFNDALINSLNHPELDSLVYRKTIRAPETRTINNAMSINIGVGPIDTSLDPGEFKTISIAASEVIGIPGFIDLATEVIDKANDRLEKQMVLIGYLVEKIQRKYEADCKIIGDPSIVKGKIYSFLNLSHLDNGKWYATKVAHRIGKKTGYFTTMDLIKIPAPIIIAKNSSTETNKGDKESKNEISSIYLSANRFIKGVGEKEYLEHYAHLMDGIIILDNYDTLVDKLNVSNIDGTAVEGFKERMERLSSEEDFLSRDEIYESNELKKRGSISKDKSNADQY